MHASARRSFLTTLVLALTLSLLCCGGTVAAAGHTRDSPPLAPRRHHAQLSRLESNRTTTTTTTSAPLSKRYDDAKFTYYHAGEGACGGTNNDNDWIVALSPDQYEDGAHCWKTIEISYQGKTAKASVADKCPGCPYAGLDMTPSLFSYFAPESEGVIYGTWTFND